LSAVPLQCHTAEKGLEQLYKQGINGIWVVEPA